jgi:hypothetical protein
MLHALSRAPSYRQRALVQIEALITQAERNLARHSAAQTGKTKTRDSVEGERRRLALLYRSRQFLLSDEFSAVTADRH